MLLRDQLGIAPSPAMQSVHGRLLGEKRTWTSRLRYLLRLGQEVLASDLADEVRMVLPDVRLGVPQELLVVLTLDHAATHAWDLLHGP